MAEDDFDCCPSFGQWVWAYVSRMDRVRDDFVYLRSILDLWTDPSPCICSVWDKQMVNVGPVQFVITRTQDTNGPTGPDWGGYNIHWTIDMVGKCVRALMFRQGGMAWDYKSYSCEL